MMMEKHNAKKIMVSLWVLIALIAVYFGLKSIVSKEDNNISAGYSQPTVSSGDGSSATGTELQGDTARGRSIQGSDVNLSNDGGSAKLLQGVQ